MRSATPKLLHPLCGRPIIAWLITAARAGSSSSTRRLATAEVPTFRIDSLAELPGKIAAFNAGGC